LEEDLSQEEEMLVKVAVGGDVKVGVDRTEDQILLPAVTRIRIKQTTYFQKQFIKVRLFYL